MEFHGTFVTTATTTATLARDTPDSADGLRARALQHHLEKTTNGSLRPVDLRNDSTNSAPSSGTATPIPEDAPPSMHSIKQARQERRRRLFPTVDYESRVSHFDPTSQHRDFHGFFTLFWIGLFIMVFTTGMRNLKDTGRVMRTSIFSLFGQAPLELAFADLFMALSTGFCMPLQQMYAHNGWSWKKYGGSLQHLLDMIWLGLWVYLPFYLQWQWTHQVFFTLHSLTLLMKIHSYSFYCGHLSECRKALAALDKNDPATESQEDADRRETLAREVTSPSGKVTYPHNLTWENFVDYILCPTLCYELSYPRTPDAGIRWGKLAEKAAAVFGCVFLLTMISEEFILPVMNDAQVRLDGVRSFSEVALTLLETISMLLFPFMITFLLVFLVIFEYVLGAFAEITRFADRHFYEDWWNSTNWLEFSREWNIPVHRFLQRHVYSASRTRMSRRAAMLVTFLISALAHELVMFCITKKLRGYGFICQMLQLPIIMFQQTAFMKRQGLFNNVMFWVSMVWGLSMISALYVLM